MTTMKTKGLKSWKYSFRSSDLSLSIKFDYFFVTGCRFDNRQGWPEYHQTQKSGKLLSLNSNSLAVISFLSSPVFSRSFALEANASETAEDEDRMSNWAEDRKNRILESRTKTYISLFMRYKKAKCFFDLSIARVFIRLIISRIFSWLRVIFISFIPLIFGDFCRIAYR